MANLIEIIKELCVIKAPEDKPFKLASGKTSNFYIDIRRAALNPRALRLLSEELYWKIIRSRCYPSLIAGVALGGCPLATGISLASLYASESPAFHNLPVFDAIYVRKDVKEHGTSKIIEGNFRKGDEVILCEDVITSGKSALQAISSLKSCGLVVGGVISVLDREEGGREAIEKECQFRSLFTLRDLEIV